MSIILSDADTYPSGMFSKDYRNTTCAYNIHDYNQKKLNDFIRSQTISDNNTGSGSESFMDYDSWGQHIGPLGPGGEQKHKLGPGGTQWLPGPWTPTQWIVLIVLLVVLLALILALV